MVPLARAHLSLGWSKLPATNNLAKSFQDRLPELWKAPPGATLTFRFRGTAAGVYDLLGPDCGKLTATVDDLKPVSIARFDSFCHLPSNNPGGVSRRPGSMPAGPQKPRNASPSAPALRGLLVHSLMCWFQRSRMVF